MTRLDTDPDRDHRLRLDRVRHDAPGHEELSLFAVEASAAAEADIPESRHIEKPVFPAPPSTPPDTSRAAAAMIAPSAGALRLRVLEVVSRKGGATCEEVCDVLGLDGNTVRPRLWELEKAAVIAKSSVRVRTRSGRTAIVYHVVDAAKAHALRTERLDGAA